MMSAAMPVIPDDIEKISEMISGLTAAPRMPSASTPTCSKLSGCSSTRESARMSRDVARCSVVSCRNGADARTPETMPRFISGASACAEPTSSHSASSIRSTELFDRASSEVRIAVSSTGELF